MRGARSGTALITGGNAGIGLATALAIASVGMDIVIVGRRARENRAAAARVQERGVRCLALECDVANGEAVERLFDRIEAECGPVSHAFNCAGLEQVQEPYDRATHEDYTRIFDTNVRGLWCCMRREVAGMRKRGGGAIVNAGSVSGSIAFAGIPLYVASKHAVHGLTRAFALEFAAEDIRINAVAPGGVATGMLSRISQGNGAAQRAFAAAHPLGRFSTPDEIASAVCWLLFDATSTTGAILTVDGGYTVA